MSTANALAIIDGAAEPIAPTTVRERLLIRRVPNKGDRRSVLLEVTPKGRRLRQESEPEHNLSGTS